MCAEYKQWYQFVRLASDLNVSWCKCELHTKELFINNCPKIRRIEIIIKSKNDRQHNLTLLFCIHPQFLLLLSEAIGAFSSASSSNVKYLDKLNLHGGLNVVAVILIGIAFWSVYTHKNNNNYDHFATQHAKLGFYTCINVVGVMCGGIAARYNSVLRNVMKPMQLKLIHSLFGAVTYTMAMYTLSLGINSDWFRSLIGDQWVGILTYAVWLVAFLALIKPFISIASRARSVFRHSNQN